MLLQELKHAFHFFKKAYNEVNEIGQCTKAGNYRVTWNLNKLQKTQSKAVR